MDALRKTLPLAAVLALLAAAPAPAAFDFRAPMFVSTGEFVDVPGGGMTPEGDVSAAWLQQDTVHVVQRQAGSPFSAETTLAKAVNEGDNNLTMDVNADGDAIIAWRRLTNFTDATVMASYSEAGGAFGAPELVAATADAIVEPQVAIADNGDAIIGFTNVVATKTVVTARRRLANGTIDTPSLSSFSDTAVNSTAPTVAMDAAGNALVVYTSNSAEMLFNYWAAGTNTVPARTSIVAAGDTSPPDRAVAFAPSGDALIVYRSAIDVEARRRPAGAGQSFGAAEKVEDFDSAPGPPGQFQLGFDSAGNATAIWFDGSVDPVRIRGALRPAGAATEFGEPGHLDEPGAADDPAPPRLAVSPGGQAFALWTVFDGGNDLFVARRPTATGAFDPPVRLPAPGRESVLGLGSMLSDGEGRGLVGYRDADLLGAGRRIVFRPFEEPIPAMTGLSLPGSGAIGETLAFSVAAPTSNWGTVSEPQWDFGDGATAQGTNVSHAYTAAGSFPVTVTSTDSAGNSNTLSGTVTVPATPGGDAGGTGGTPPPPSPGATADTTKPSITALSFLPTRFEAARRGPTISAVGSRLTYALSEAARTTFTVHRVLPGRRRGQRCEAPTRRNRRARRCSRFKLAGSFAHTGKAGANTLRFSGRLKRRKLAPGTYRLRAVAVDAAGNRSAARTAIFRILPPRTRR